MKPRVAILISGSGSNMVSLLKSMQNTHPAEPCLVLANRADATGLEKAAALGVKTAFVDHKPFGEDRQAFENELIKVIEGARADVICLAGFMRVLSSHFIDHYEGRMLNIHPSLLPKYKGLNTHKRAIDAGDTVAGCTVHEVTAKLDDGPILAQARVDILADDTPERLAARVLAQEHIIYPQALRSFVSK